MAAENSGVVTLDPTDLNETDRAILDYLRDEGRASPTLFIRATDADTSRQWISSRFVRLAEHDHIRDLYETGIYELVEDPREEDDDE